MGKNTRFQASPGMVHLIRILSSQLHVGALGLKF